DNFDEQNHNGTGQPLPDNQADSTAGHRIIGANDHQLMRATLNLTSSASTDGTWQITFPNRIRVWRENGGVFTQVQSRTASANLTVNGTTAIPLWIEGISASDDLRDVELVAQFTPANGNAEVDRARLTVTQVNLQAEIIEDGLLNSQDDF